jgi:hypothetical protein
MSGNGKNEHSYFHILLPTSSFSSVCLAPFQEFGGIFFGSVWLLVDLNTTSLYAVGLLFVFIVESMQVGRVGVLAVDLIPQQLC